MLFKLIFLALFVSMLVFTGCNSEEFYCDETIKRDPNFCVINYAEFKNDPSICESLGNSSLSRIYFKDICYRNLAIKSGDISLCKLIPKDNRELVGLNFSNTCFITVAYASGNITMCDEMDDPVVANFCRNSYNEGIINYHIRGWS